MTVENKVIIILLVLILTFYSYYIKGETPKIKEDNGQTLGVVDEDERTLWGSLNPMLMEGQKVYGPKCIPLQAFNGSKSHNLDYVAEFIPNKQMTIGELKIAISESMPRITNDSSVKPVEINFNDYRNKLPIWERFAYEKLDVNVVFINGLKEDKPFPFVRKKDCDLLTWNFFLHFAGVYDKKLAKKLQEDSWNSGPETYAFFSQINAEPPLLMAPKIRDISREK